MDKNPLLEQPTGKPSMAPGFHSLTPKPTVFLFQLTLRPPFPLSLFIPIQSSPSSTETSCQISHLCLPPFTTQQNLYKLTVSQNRTYSHCPFSLLPPLFHLLCFFLGVFSSNGWLPRSKARIFVWFLKYPDRKTLLLSSGVFAGVLEF